jgi:hypothetical protein
VHALLAVDPAGILEAIAPRRSAVRRLAGSAP